MTENNMDVNKIKKESEKSKKRAINSVMQLGLDK